MDGSDTVCIEFLGVPGAGKSGLVAEVIDELRVAGIDTVDMDEAVYAAMNAETRDPLIRFLLRYLPSGVRRRSFKHLAARSQDRLLALRGFLLAEPDAGIVILEALRDRRDLDPHQDLAFGWIVELMWSYQVAMKSEMASYSNIVLDEGFCNRALTLFGYRFSDEDHVRLRTYIESIPKPALVIVVTADAKRAASRATQRIRFEHLSDDELKEYTRDVERCVDATKLLLVERGVDVREVRNDGTQAEASEKARSVIRDWLNT